MKNLFHTVNQTRFIDVCRYAVNLLQKLIDKNAQIVGDADCFGQTHKRQPTHS